MKEKEDLNENKNNQDIKQELNEKKSDTSINYSQGNNIQKIDEIDAQKENNNNQKEKQNNTSTLINAINDSKIIKNNSNYFKNEKNEKELKDNYKQEINKYLVPFQLKNEYINIVNNNPEKLFEIINQRTIMFWQSVVYNDEATLIDSDSDILSTVPERNDQQIIINDSNRTRFKESSLIPGFKKILEEVLTFYCNTKKIKYKQGINEIFGPLILIKYKIKNLKLVNIFNFGEAFIDRFLPNYFYENDLYSLRSSISLFINLLKYHEPSVYNYLDSLEIPHELYATNWLLTLRAQKLNLDILYNLWDNIIRINDPLFIHFIFVALIIYKRELLINCDSNLLLKLMVGLTITSMAELNKIIKIALDLRSKTPFSFRLLSNEIGFLKTNNKNIRENFEKYKPESIPSLPIFPIEILYSNYSNNIICPDPQCLNNLKNKKIKSDLNSSYNINNHICEKCNMKIDKNINYVILDLRLFPPSYFKDDEDHFKMGIVSGMMTIDKEELKSDNIDSLITSKLISIRGKNHIILMTSSTDNFFDFEQNYYSDIRSELMKKKILFGVIEAEKSEKQLNLIDAEKNLDLKEIYKLKEYDNLRRIMIEMKKKNFPYVSYLEGGFEALHSQSLNYNIELVDHNSKICNLCKNIKKETEIEKRYRKLNSKDKIINISNTLWKNKKVITEKELNSLFFNEKNIVIVCSLKKYKNKYFHKKEIEVFVAILYDKNIIEIYKHELREEIQNKLSLYNLENKKYYDLGMKDKEKKGNFVLRLFVDIKFDEIENIIYDKKSINSAYLQIKIREKEKNQKKLDNNTFEIGFDFYSIQDSKTFINSIKRIKKNENSNIFS